jgi:cell division protein FtsB
MNTAKFFGWAGIILVILFILTASTSYLSFGILDVIIISIVFISLSETLAKQQNKIEKMEKDIEKLERKLNELERKVSN